MPIVVAEAQVAKVRLHEPADQVGVAVLTGALLEEGTTHRSGLEIARAIEDTGGSLNMTALGGSVKVLADDTALGLDLLFDCLAEPVFHEDELTSKRDQLLAELAEQEKQADRRALRAFKSAVYGKHPFGWPEARPEVIRKLTSNDLKRFHGRVFVPGNTVVAIVGDFDAEKVVNLVRKRTAGWKNAKLDPPMISPPPPPDGPKQTIISEPSASQLTMYLGHLGIKRDNPDYYKLLVMDYVLGTGSGFTDRLSASLRDRQGLAYSVSARITGSAGEEPGAFTGYIGTFPEKFAEVKAGFMKEINQIRNEVPANAEVENVKRYLMGALAFTMTTCNEAADMLLLVDRYRLGENYLSDYRKAVDAVTPEDVRAVARKYLDPSHLIVIAAGPIDGTGKPLADKNKD